MSKDKKPKTYWIPDNMHMSRETVPIDEIFGSVSSFDINMPIHPDYAKVLKPNLSVGDLVETFSGKVGIIIEVREAIGVFLRVKGANNNYYKVLIGDDEAEHIGYSLKKIKNNLEKK